MLRFKKTLVSVICGLMMASLFTGCSGGGKTDDPEAGSTTKSSTESTEAKGEKETTAKEENTGGREKLSLGANMVMEAAKKDWWPSDFFKLIEDKLNIDFEWVEYDADKQNLALASGDLPDLMMVNDSKPILDGKLAVAMDDYLKENGPNIQKYTVRNDMIRKYLSNGDGKLYFHTPNTGGEDITGGTEIWNGFLVRWDLYKQVGAPVMKNDDDYIKVLKQMQQAYPKTGEGLPVYGIGVHNDWGLWGWMMRAFANEGFSNVNSWAYAVNTNTNELVNNFLDTEKGPFWHDMDFYNKLYLDGLLDPDSFTMKSEQVGEKAGKGQYLGGYCTWFTGDLYANERQKDPNTMKGIMAVPGEGQNGWYGQNALVGWGDKLLFITNKAKNVPLAVKFIDFIDSDEANRAHYSGIEGKHWKYNDKGIPEVLPETLKLRSEGGDEWDKTGINSFANFVGASGFGKHSDGYYYNLFDDPAVKAQTLSPLQKDFSEFYKVEYPAQLHYNMVKEGKATNQQNALHTTIMLGVNAVPSDISRIDSQLEEIVTRAIPSLVKAKNGTEFEEAKAKLVNDLKKANAEKAWEWWKSQWDTSKAYVESIAK
jgi:putative aldouronate transport system substrate-binding protein